MSKILRFSAFVVLLALAVPAVAAPPAPRTPSILERIEAVVRWIRPAPAKPANIRPKCRGTVDPNGICVP